MARTTKAERKRRREAALVKISEGYGFADTATFVMQEGGAPDQLQDGTVIGRMVSFSWALMRTMLSTL